MIFWYIKLVCLELTLLGVVHQNYKKLFFCLQESDVIEIWFMLASNVLNIYYSSQNVRGTTIHYYSR